jgi:hypothetical protein
MHDEPITFSLQKQEVEIEMGHSVEMEMCERIEMGVPIG